jgi:hypothetical protein
MKKIIGKFIANIRQKLLARRVHREIEHCIFPQLVGDKNCGYPFGDSDEELEKLATFGALDAQQHLAIIESRARLLPDTYGHAFRYLAYRDLNKRLEMYEEFARKLTWRKSAPLGPQPQLAT